jgi:prevent-host-death family protein
MGSRLRGNDAELAECLGSKNMDVIEHIKPITYLKSNATDIVKAFEQTDQGPIIITQNGEAKMVVISYKDYQENLTEKKEALEKMALMKLIAMGNKEIANGNVTSEKDFLAEMDRA